MFLSMIISSVFSIFVFLLMYILVPALMIIINLFVPVKVDYKYYTILAAEVVDKFWDFLENKVTGVLNEEDKDNFRKKD